MDSVVGDPKGVTRIERKIIGLTRMRDGMIIRQDRPAACQQVDISGLRVSDDFLVRMVFFDHHDDVIVIRCEAGCSHR